MMEYWNIGMMCSSAIAWSEGDWRAGFKTHYSITPTFLGPDPWPRPGMQGLSSMNYTPEVLQLLYSIPAKSRQGRLICNA